jgi:hypothetical protein
MNIDTGSFQAASMCMPNNLKYKLFMLVFKLCLAENFQVAPNDT